jgi:hypothetical protein
MPTSSTDLHSVSQSPIMQSMSHKGCPMQLVAGWQSAAPLAGAKAAPKEYRSAFICLEFFISAHTSTTVAHRRITIFQNG